MLGTGLTSADQGEVCTIAIAPLLFTDAIREKQLAEKIEYKAQATEQLTTKV